MTEEKPIKLSNRSVNHSLMSIVRMGDEHHERYHSCPGGRKPDDEIKYKTKKSFEIPSEDLDHWINRFEEAPTKDSVNWEMASKYGKHGDTCRKAYVRAISNREQQDRLNNQIRTVNSKI